MDDGRARYTTKDGVTVAYKIRGEGPVDILMGPFGTISFESAEDEPGLARFERRLASMGRSIRYDWRGMGLSDRGSDSGASTVEHQVADALAVLDAAGSERAAVIGSYYGVPAAIALAVTHPERVSHLILINGFARWFRADDFPYGMAIDHDLVGDYSGGQFEPDALDQGIDVLAILAPSMASDPTFRSWWDRAGNLGATPAVAQGMFEAAVSADVRYLLPSVVAPTLVIERPDAGVDGWVPQGEYIAAQIEGGEYLGLPGADALHWVGDRSAVLDAIEEFVTGVRGRAGAERVLAAVLFTDIVDSTRRAGELGDDQWHDLLDRHDQIVRRQIERFHGRAINTTGDGFVATFDVPSRAIECAQAIHAALAGSGIDVRTGLHAGELEARGDDIAGVAVHIGARVAARAGAGEVLVSSTVRDLVVGSPFEFEPAGEHELKGVPGVWTLYAVRS